MSKKIFQLVDEKYTNSNCAQVMFGYRKTLLLENKDEILYDNLENINLYLDDDRRLQFPYNNIPMHYEKHLFRKMTYVNQILDYNRAYMCKVDDLMFHLQLFKDKYATWLKYYQTDVKEFNTLDIMADESTIKFCVEPKFPLKLNNDLFSKKDLDEAKRQLRRLRK